MNKKRIDKIIVFTLIAVVLAAGSVYAGTAPQPETVAAAEPETVVVPQVKTYGEENEQAVRFEFVNGTGKDITYLSLQVDDGTDKEKEEIKKLQQALIDQGFLDDIVDGSFGPKTKAAVKAFREEKGLSADETVDAEMLTLLYGEYDDGNVLGEGEVIKPEETVVIFYQPDKEEEKEEAENVFAVNELYTAAFKLTGEEDTEFVLHTLPLDETSIKILVEEEIAFVEYQTDASEGVISTLETEKAIAQPVVQEYSDYDDYYYDYSYDWSEPVYENNAQGVDGCIDIYAADTW